MSDNALNNGDSPDLEALFDSIVQSNSIETSTLESAAKPAQEPATAMAEPAKSMFSHIGQLTRKLHDTLRELGLDKSLESAAASIPDARDRLSYVATMTEQAAERTLNALDIAKPLQDSITESSKQLSTEWDKFYNHKLSVDEFKHLVARTRAHLANTAQQSEQVSTQMLEIMMAQDFQDLTGQVIKRVLSMAKDMESHLLDFLLMFNPQGPSKIDDASLLNGPVVSAEGRTDIVTNQEQVDDLLESLGF
ncbi:MULTISPECIES: protein phosphatase CheZ [Deefgea]|uniref:Protein phosphatase CheZ n=1 Tax=Deefgea chitinilytica TaxID=570276 RepID=A0ABS2CGX4_9NEIS|nr:MULTISPECIES: protein phosphatase CheZ [Deefgea]MBM5572965.1 protein phosphatase CheZ [Deefgea chitinilytica]MBM9890201.1 protein phosphatase CheZ [Deefgea sp. CFH1-16]